MWHPRRCITYLLDVNNIYRAPRSTHPPSLPLHMRDNPATWHVYVWVYMHLLWMSGSKQAISSPSTNPTSLIVGELAATETYHKPCPGFRSSNLSHSFMGLLKKLCEGSPPTDCLTSKPISSHTLEPLCSATSFSDREGLSAVQGAERPPRLSSIHIPFKMCVWSERVDALLYLCFITLGSRLN